MALSNEERNRVELASRMFFLTMYGDGKMAASDVNPNDDRYREIYRREVGNALIQKGLDALRKSSPLLTARSGEYSSTVELEFDQFEDALAVHDWLEFMAGVKTDRKESSNG